MRLCMSWECSCSATAKVLWAWLLFPVWALHRPDRAVMRAAVIFEAATPRRFHTTDPLGPACCSSQGLSVSGRGCRPAPGSRPRRQRAPCGGPSPADLHAAAAPGPRRAVWWGRGPGSPAIPDPRVAGVCGVVAVPLGWVQACRGLAFSCRPLQTAPLGAPAWRPAGPGRRWPRPAAPPAVRVRCG